MPRKHLPARQRWVVAKSGWYVSAWLLGIRGSCCRDPWAATWFTSKVQADLCAQDRQPANVVPLDKALADYAARHPQRRLILDVF